MNEHSIIASFMKCYRTNSPPPPPPVIEKCGSLFGDKETLQSKKNREIYSICLTVYDNILEEL